MNPLSIIGTGIALVKYRKARNEYEQLKERKDTLEAAIATYNDFKESEVYPEVEKIYKTNEITYPDGLLVTSVLKVANLVGKIFYAKPALVVTNTTNKKFVLFDIDVTCSIFGEVVGSSDKFVFPYSIEILPNETVDIYSNKSKAGFVNPETIGRLRDEICALNGKKLITSCGKTNVDGIETAHISFQWSQAGEKGEAKKAEWMAKPGLLRYCMELSLIGE